MIKLFACGDIVNYNNPDGMLLAESMEDVVKSADYSIFNFEAPIKNSGDAIPKSGIHHCQREVTLKGLKEQGFNLALLANNHIMDFGRDGLEATLNASREVGLETLGAGTTHNFAYSTMTKDVNGVKIGIINGGEAQFGVIDHFDRGDSCGYAWINHPIIDRNVLELRKQCDFVLVFSHAGLEDFDIPQKEWRERYKHLCDLGADAIIGSHPHVPQGYEKHNDSVIFYSLGNFYFDGGRWRGNENASFSIMLTMEKGEAISFEVIHHYTDNDKVALSPKEKEVNLEYLCNKLSSNYVKHHDQMTLSAYPRVKNNLLKSLSPIPTNLPTLHWRLREFVATIIGRRKGVDRTLDDSLMAMHFVRNEAYYYVMRHALELDVKGKIDHE